jgi:predicted phage terminase large subunit-like protein
MNLHTFARYISVDSWKPWRYLVLISRVVQRAATEGNGRVLVTLPPRHGKSLLCSMWLPAWFLHWWPDRRVLLASYGSNYASTWGEKVRRLFTDELSPIREPLNPHRAAACEWELAAGGGMMCGGVDGGFTGRGGNLLIADDLHKNWEEAHSPRKLQALRDWWNSTFWTRREPNATVVFVTTRWHPQDHAGWLLEREGERWQHLDFPALARAGDPLGRGQGEALCPRRFNEAALEEIRATMTPSKFQAVYQCDPRDETEAIWPRTWWRHWTEIPHSPDRWVQSWDLTFGSKTKAASYVCGQVWCTKGADRYLVAQVRGRWSFTETLAQIRLLSRAWPRARTKMVEAKANGPAVMDALSRELGGFVPIQPYGSKVARAEAVAPIIMGRNVYLPDPADAPWVAGFIDECALFPRARNDDQVDTASQALNHLQAHVFRMRVSRL